MSLANQATLLFFCCINYKNFKKRLSGLFFFFFKYLNIHEIMQPSPQRGKKMKKAYKIILLIQKLHNSPLHTLNQLPHLSDLYRCCMYSSDESNDQAKTTMPENNFKPWACFIFLHTFLRLCFMLLFFKCQVLIQSAVST